MLLSYTAQSPRETGKRVLKFTIPSMVALGLVSCAANWLCQSGLPMTDECEHALYYAGTFPAAISLVFFGKLIAFGAAVVQDPGGGRYPVCVTAVATLLAVLLRGYEWGLVCRTAIVSRLSKSNDSEGPVDTADASTALLNRTPQREAPSVRGITYDFAAYVIGLARYGVVASADALLLNPLCALKAAIFPQYYPVLPLTPFSLRKLGDAALHVPCGSCGP